MKKNPVPFIVPNAEEALQKAGVCAQDFFERHWSGDRGDLPGRRTHSTESGPSLSAFQMTKGERVWVYTNSTGSCTILMLPHEMLTDKVTHELECEFLHKGLSRPGIWSIIDQGMTLMECGAIGLVDDLLQRKAIVA